MSKKSDDYVRPPDKSTKMRLIGDDSNDPNGTFENDEDFLRYKFLTMHNRKLSNEDKEVMIASKREQMVQMRNLGHVFSGGSFNPFCENNTNHLNTDDFIEFNDFNDFNSNDIINDINDIGSQSPLNSMDELKRDEKYAMLIELIFANYEEFDIYCDVEGLVISIDQYLNNIIDEIILQSDVCWAIRQNIETYSFENRETKEKLKKIFVPDSIHEYEQFNLMMISQKTSNENNSTKEINKQIQLQYELEEKDKMQQMIIDEDKKIMTEKTEQRNMIINNLFHQLTRLGAYDPSVKELKNEISPIVEKYIKLEIENIVLQKDLYEQLVKFIKQIRMDLKLKDKLMNIFISQ